MSKSGSEYRAVFKKCVLEAAAKATQLVAQWTEYSVTSKIMETPKIVLLELTSTNA